MEPSSPKGNLPQREVISFCTREHLSVWGLTSRLVPRFIEADKYTVFVPEKDFVLFTSLPKNDFRVRPDSDLNLQFLPELVSRLAILGNSRRLGWYRQQFLKLSALEAATANGIVIWDADCVPSTRVQFFSEGGLPVFVRASENRASYFDATRKLFGARRLTTWSFIAPGFPFPKSWANQFFEELSFLQTGLPWWRKILDSIDLGDGAGFSEYETLGTWAALRHPDKLLSQSIEWERFGQSRFGKASTISVDKFLKITDSVGLDVVSFEKWDVPTLGQRLKLLLESIAFRSDV